MFRINRRTDYSIRVMLCLAVRPPGERVATQIVQEEMQVPRAFLQRIIADLSRAGMIFTYPGPNGGLELARKSGEINLRHIWEAIEGPILVSDCLKAPGECALDSTCPVRSRWGKLQKLIVGEMEATSLDRLAAEAKLLRLSPKQMLKEMLVLTE